MSDVKASILSRLTNLFPSEAVVSAKPADNSRYDDRSSVANAEPHLFAREENFYWTWQYPSQW